MIDITGARVTPHRVRIRPLTTSLMAAACLLTAGCAVGPDFVKPAPPKVSGYAAEPLPASTASANVTGGEAQHFTEGRDISADWWTLFHSKAMSALVEQALANNHDLKAAQAALKVAHENTEAQRGAYFPKVTAGFSATREQDPPGALAAVPSNNAFLYNLYTPEVSVSYSPDIFGLNQRTVESLAAQEQSARFQMIAARITLTANVVAAAVQEASLEAQVDATRQIVASATDMVRILQYQLDKGYASRLDLAAQQSLLAQSNASLPGLLKQLIQQQHLIAVLAGQFPNQAPQKFGLADLTLPQDLPVSLPSTLVAQRPDVLQAEANMHAANAEIGVAVANRLPNIQLTANAGSTALEIGQVFGPGTGFWNIGAALAGTIFDGGTLMHQEHAARANYVQTAEQYRSTVLSAFQNVADTLTALDQDAAALKAAAAANDAAKVTLDLSQRQYKDGYAGYLSLLTAEQAYQQARIALVQAQAARYADTAALFEALGGGWWNAANLTKDSHD
jgi:NodT family efflux transporter outer membrane factor (OMF) lipoprotein